MKKLFLIVALFLSQVSYSQFYTESIDTTKETLTSLYSSTLSSMADIYDNYNVSVLCDSALRISMTLAFTEYIVTKAAVWNDLGTFNSVTVPQLWFRKNGLTTDAVTPSFIISKGK